MKKLLDAFLDLPTQDGILLIGVAVFIVLTVALIVDRIAWRRGWNQCRAHWENKLQARGADQVSERI